MPVQLCCLHARSIERNTMIKQISLSAGKIHALFPPERVFQSCYQFERSRQKSASAKLKEWRLFGRPCRWPQFFHWRMSERGSNIGWTLIWRPYRRDVGFVSCTIPGSLFRQSPFILPSMTHSCLDHFLLNDTLMCWARSQSVIHFKSQRAHCSIQNSRDWCADV